MATRRQWALSFARQAQSDLDTYDLLADISRVPQCQQLHLLQMACEKLCKAHLYDIGSATPGNLDRTHAVVAKHLPEILSFQYDVKHLKRRGHSAKRSVEFRAIAQQVEFLAPACDGGGNRPDNCEYPWEDARQSTITPIDHSFPNLSLLYETSGKEFLKSLRTAMNRKVAKLHRSST